MAILRLKSLTRLFGRLRPALFICPPSAYIGIASRKGGYGDKWPS